MITYFILSYWVMINLELVNTLIHFVVTTISDSGYLGVFLLMIAEGTIIPIPSEIVMPFSGYLVSTGKFSFGYVIFAGSMGNLVGAIILYLIGKYLGRNFILYYGKYLFLKKSHLELIEKYFKKFGDGSVFVGRMLPIVRGPISLPAGISSMSMTKFIVFTFGGSIIWNSSLTYIGFQLGNRWNEILEYSNYFYIFTAIFAISIIVLIVRKRI
jgi:membrane protein DedA with SNARE-associated domain